MSVADPRGRAYLQGMTSSSIVPCLWFDNSAQRAASFYVAVFGSGHITGVSHYPETVDNPGHKPRGSVLAVEFEIDGQRFTALNGGPQFRINPSISFFVHTDSVAETNRLFGALADGGKVLMPLKSYPWSERYGWVIDPFGVSWQVIKRRGEDGPLGATIVPCLMFSGSQHGRADEAMHNYAGIFPNSRVTRIERYNGDDGPAGTVKHGRFILDGQEMIAMDSHVSTDIAFNEGVSLQVMCEDQAQVDRYWDVLSDGGEGGPCGWLTDRYGLSWQVAPIVINDWMTSDNSAARDRVFQAMLRMTKLDIATLDDAFMSAQ